MTNDNLFSLAQISQEIPSMEKTFLSTTKMIKKDTELKDNTITKSLLNTIENYKKSFSDIARILETIEYATIANDDPIKDDIKACFGELESANKEVLSLYKEALSAA